MTSLAARVSRERRQMNHESPLGGGLRIGKADECGVREVDQYDVRLVGGVTKPILRPLIHKVVFSGVVYLLYMYAILLNVSKQKA
jgi:hypothetical protein